MTRGGSRGANVADRESDYDISNREKQTRVNGALLDLLYTCSRELAALAFRFFGDVPSVPLVGRR